MGPEVATTGISGLDAQLGGGVPRGSTILLLAEPSNVLSMFTEQFASGGLADHEEVLYYEFDRPPTGIRERIVTLGTNGKAPEGSLRLFDGYTTQFGGATANGSGTDAAEPIPRDGVYARILADINAGAGRERRVVVDSLSALVRDDDANDLVDFMRHLVYLGHQLGTVQLLTMVKGLHDPALECRLKHLASGVLEVGLERKGFGVYSTLQVCKMQDVRDALRIMLFKETDKGLWLESTKRVF